MSSKKNATSFKKGQSGNPAGRPVVPPDIKAARQVNQIEVERILNHVSFLPVEQINKLVKDEKAPALLVGAAKIMQKLVKYGDLWAASFILDRMIGRPGNAPPIDVTPPPAIVQPANPKTFKEFCLTAGYFDPYPEQENMRSFAMDEDIVRLLLGARGYGKTDYCTIMGVAYSLYLTWFHKRDLDLDTNLIITKSKARNTAIMNEISQALEKNGVPLEKANASTIRIEGLIGQDHSAEAITIKTSMRGRHPKRIIMDDPVTDEDVSQAMRDVVKRRYDEAYKLCQNIVIIGQPAHFDDLYAQLRNVIKTKEVPHGTIPELDADLDAMILAGVDRTSIEMSYHLRIPADGASIFSNIKFIDSFLPGDSVAFIDPSDGGDYTAISIFKGYMSGVAVKGHAWKKAWYHCMDELVAVLKASGVRRICFETNSTGQQPIDQLRQVLGPLGIGVVGVHSDTNKHATILQAGSFAHLIHLSKDSDKVYTDQVIKYELKAKNDDAPDSLARGLVWLGLITGKK